MRILLCLFLPVCLLLGGIGFFVYRGVSLSFENQMREEVELIARTLAKPVAYSIERDRSNSLVDALTTAFEFERVYGAYLYDMEGNLIAQAHYGRIDESPVAATPFGVPEKPTGSYQTHMGERVFSFFVPLTGPVGHPLGMLQVTRSGQEMRASIARLQGQLIFAYSLFIVGFSIFLDEIGELSPELQAKLLRVLQEGTMRPVGAASEVETDARIMAAISTLRPSRRASAGERSMIS